MPLMLFLLPVTLRLGRRSLLVLADFFDAAFTNASASAFSNLGMYFKVKRWNLRSKALTMAKYLTSSGSRAIYFFLTWPARTWESILTSSVFAPSAFALLSPSIRPSYSAILFVALNSSLAAYFIWSPEGATKMAEALAPE
jgi:hypothetical protein